MAREFFQIELADMFFRSVMVRTELAASLRDLFLAVVECVRSSRLDFVPQNAITMELCLRLTEPILKQEGKEKQREEM